MTPLWLSRTIVRSLLYVSVCCTFAFAKALPASVNYDQTQFGDYNVQISLKNIELYALIEEGSPNVEYDYDYADLTEKPSNSTPGATTVKVSYYNSSRPPKPTSSLSTQQPYQSSSSSYQPSPYSSSLQAGPPLLPINLNDYINEMLLPGSNGTASDLTVKVTRKCAPGFYRDQLGKCRRIRKPHLPYLQMVHTPGVIKSFQHTTSDLSTSSTAQTSGKPIKILD